MVLRGEAFEKQLAHEDGALMERIITLIKEAQESSRAPFSEWRYSEKTNLYEPGRKLLLVTESASTLILDFRLQNYEQ